MFGPEFVKNKIENQVPFWGVVEDNADPMTLGRVKVRCFNFHSENIEDIPTESLPWALVLQPTTSASVSGVGESPNGLEKGSWVYGFFMDGKDAQYPVVTHSVPGIHRPDTNGLSGTSNPYLNNGNGDTYSSGDSTGTSDNNTEIYGPQQTPTNPAEQGSGALTAVGDIEMMLQPKDGPNFKKLGIVNYTANAAPEGFACKDGRNSMRFHYGTALALEKLTSNWGKGKFFITSAYRTPAYNAGLKGAAKHSLHMEGRALDIDLGKIGRSRPALAAFGQAAVKCGFTGFGIYNSFIHIDTGTGRVWKGAKGAWFIKALKEAGWYEGKPGLSGVRVEQGTADETNTNTDGTQNPTGSGLNLTNPVEKQIYDHYSAQGMSDAQIAGILGNARTESGFNPYVKVTDTNGLTSYGLFQWNGARYTQLQNFTGQTNPGVADQLRFADWEMANTAHGRNARAALMSSNDPASAAYGFGRHFEVYQGYRDPNSASSQKRIGYANEYYGGTNNPVNPQGFTDPTNSLPTPEYRGEPSTHMNARGFNSNGNNKRIVQKDNGRMTGIPAAGDTGTFGEPELKAAPQYPYNHVKSSRSGHLFEMDDTPGAERMNFEHKSGSGIEIFNDGSFVRRAKGNAYNTIFGSEYTGVLGKFYLSSINDMHIRSTSDMVLQSDGAMTLHMGNDGTLIVSGDYTITAGEDIKFKAAKIVIEATESIDILSHKSVNIEGKEGVNIKGGKSVNIDGGPAVNVKGQNVYMDDVVRVAEGKAKTLDGADSADLGTPPKRKDIDKTQTKTMGDSTNPGTTTEEAAEYYAQYV